LCAAAPLYHQFGLNRPALCDIIFIMHHDFLDKYRERQSHWSARSVMFRLVWAVLFVILTATIPAGETTPLAVLIGLLATTALASQLPFGFLIVRSLLLSLPAWLIALPMAFYQPQGAQWYAFMAIKSWGAVTMMTILITTTPFPGMLNTLRRMRCPELLLSLLGFTYRYIFLLTDESERLQLTFRARAAAAPAVYQRRALAGIAASLFTRSLERSERIYDAMLARGFDGSYPGIPAAEMTVGECIMLLMLSIIAIGARIHV
jgi:cobalt/nickel transport system permease protein